VTHHPSAAALACAAILSQAASDVFSGWLAILALLAVSDRAAALDTADLSGSCFARTYDRAYLAAHPGQRVAAIAVQFSDLADSLLAGVSYKLRYGPRFGFSGECYGREKGAILCDACGTADSCRGTRESFKVVWSGGDVLQIVNDTTGLAAANPAGGRDRLNPNGPHRTFHLSRAAPEACAANGNP